MKKLRDATAIVTGASRGIGVHIARALAQQGVNLALAARDGERLATVQQELSQLGVRCLAIPTDLLEQAALEALVERTQRELGPVDLLVNNAGVERSLFFEDSNPEELERSVHLNLISPMQLTRLLLPGMLERNRGHVVNMGSLAGMGPAAYGETYSATKHGIIGFSRSLRASLKSQGSAVSASVINPGFVSEAGMYADKRASFDVGNPTFLGTSPPSQVAKAVVKAIRKDLPDIVVNPGPMRLNLASVVLFPRFAEWLAKVVGVHEVNRRAAVQGREQAPKELVAQREEQPPGPSTP